MGREGELTQAFIEAYQRTGEQTGYWATRFLQAVRRNGGYETAKRMLLPRNASQRQGLDVLIAAGKKELTVEAIILEPRFRGLFTAEQLAVAAERLGEFDRAADSHRRTRERLYPDDLEPGRQYAEGAKRQVRVNAYERDPRARRACLAHHGYTCKACEFDFEATYGPLGRGFIHVHHLKPLALSKGAYQLDPIRDLVPICPNCHAMIHREENPLTIQQLRARLRTSARRRVPAGG